MGDKLPAPARDEEPLPEDDVGLRAHRSADRSNLPRRLRNKMASRVGKHGQQTRWQLRTAREQALMRPKSRQQIGVDAGGAGYACNGGECAVCLEGLVAPVKLSPCAHVFCRACIKVCRQRRNACPICRAKILRITACERITMAKVSAEVTATAATTTVSTQPLLPRPSQVNTTVNAIFSPPERSNTVAA